MDFAFGLADVICDVLMAINKILDMFSVIPLKYNSTANVINEEKKN